MFSFSRKRQKGKAIEAVSVDTFYMACALLVVSITDAFSKKSVQNDTLKDHSNETTVTETENEEVAMETNQTNDAPVLLPDETVDDASTAGTDQDGDDGNCNGEDCDDGASYDSDYSYEDEDAAYDLASGSEDAAPSSKKQKWREPPKEAVSMSLRAQNETNGGKRRLAQELYRAMMVDSEEHGFELEPASEDSMDKWTIKMFHFDPDSDLNKDMIVLGLEYVELEMTFPEQYPFEPPFVRVVRPKFNGGFVYSGALCMELLTKDGWNPVNDIESVLISIRTMMVVGDGRLRAAAELTSAQYAKLLAKKQGKSNDDDTSPADEEEMARLEGSLAKQIEEGYSVESAKQGHASLSNIHEKHGWSSSWNKRG